MEVPSWVGKVATGVALSNPVTAPVVLGKWVADKAVGPRAQDRSSPAHTAPGSYCSPVPPCGDSGAARGRAGRRG